MKERLQARYAELAARVRALGKEPPALPETDELNTLASVNRVLVGMLNGHDGVVVTVKSEPVVFPLVEPKDAGTDS